MCHRLVLSIQILLIVRLEFDTIFWSSRYNNYRLCGGGGGVIRLSHAFVQRNTAPTPTCRTSCRESAYIQWRIKCIQFHTLHSNRALVAQRQSILRTISFIFFKCLCIFLVFYFVSPFALGWVFVWKPAPSRPRSINERKTGFLLAAELESVM